MTVTSNPCNGFAAIDMQRAAIIAFVILETGRFNRMIFEEVLQEIICFKPTF